jgi:hypothetical protein
MALTDPAPSSSLKDYYQIIKIKSNVEIFYYNTQILHQIVPWHEMQILIQTRKLVGSKVVSGLDFRSKSYGGVNQTGPCPEI